MRAEVEKVLQEQRLEKIKREYEKQKKDDDKSLKQQLWLEDQKKAILMGKMGGIDTSQYPTYQQQVQQRQSP